MVLVATNLVRSVGFAMRKSKKDLQPGPRRDLVVESLAVALSLLAEMADPTPELVKLGGLDLLVQLACKPSSEEQQPIEPPQIILTDAPNHCTEAVYLDDGAEVEPQVGSATVFENAPLIVAETVVMDVELGGTVGSFGTIQKIDDLIGTEAVVESPILYLVPPGSGGAPDVAAQNPQQSTSAWMPPSST